MGGQADIGGAATPQATGVNPQLAQAFMSNQASNQPTQGATLPQIMQPQQPMTDIAAMIAQQRQATAQAIPRPAVVAPAPAQKVPERRQRGGEGGSRGHGT